MAYCSPKRAILGCICVLFTNKLAFVLGFSKWLNNFTLPSLKRTVFTGEVLVALLTGNFCSFTADFVDVVLVDFLTELFVVDEALAFALSFVGFAFSA